MRSSPGCSEYFGVGDASDAGQSDAASTPGELPLEEAESSRRCRYCAGTMYLTDRTERPRVIEMMWMPWGGSQARPGPIVTLGANVPDAQAGSARSHSRKSQGGGQSGSEFTAHLRLLVT